MESTSAAGMLAPQIEAEYGEEMLASDHGKPKNMARFCKRARGETGILLIIEERVRSRYPLIETNKNNLIIVLVFSLETN